MTLVKPVHGLFGVLFDDPISPSQKIMYRFILQSVKPSSYSSKSRSTTVKARDLVNASSTVEMETSLWDKVLSTCTQNL